MIEMRKAIQACLDDPLTAGLDSATKSAQICLIIAPFMEPVTVPTEKLYPEAPYMWGELVKARNRIAELEAVAAEVSRNTHHNHVTRGIKPRGECPACDKYHERAIQSDAKN